MCDRLVGKDGERGRERVAGVLEKQRDGREEGTKEIRCKRETRRARDRS